MSDSTKTIQEECYGTCWGAQQRIDELTQYLNAANVEIEEKRKDVVYLATEKAKLEERIKRLEELGKELRECANLIGNYKSNEMETIEQAEAAVEAWDKEAKL